MDVAKKSKGKRGLIVKTWERCRSIGSGSKGVSGIQYSSNSKSWPSSSPTSPDRVDKRKTKRRVAPEGCFSVYVGPQKQRFVIKTDCINHPLFKILLEEAELEYGYSCEGPLMLPCDVDIFYKVLSEMDVDDDDDIHRGCNFAKGYRNSYRLLSPSRLVTMDHVFIN